MPKTTYLARVSVVSAVVDEEERMEFIYWGYEMFG